LEFNVRYCAFLKRGLGSNRSKEALEEVEDEFGVDWVIVGEGSMPNE